MTQRSVDKHNRWRSKTVGFRMSPEENKALDMAVKLSGLTKQEYLIRRALQREVVVQGNPRVYKALRNELAKVLEQLQNLTKASELDSEFLKTIQLITITLDGMRR